MQRLAPVSARQQPRPQVRSSGRRSAAAAERWPWRWQVTSTAKCSFTARPTTLMSQHPPHAGTMSLPLSPGLAERVQRARRLLAESEAHAGSADLQASSVEPHTADGPGAMLAPLHIHKEVIAVRTARRSRLVSGHLCAHLMHSRRTS